MFKNKKILAVITARGGSRRLPRKNTLMLRARPLIVWTIDEALRSRYVDKVIVSTDDRSAARISEEYGAGVPFIRPARLATAKAESLDVLLHALTWFEASGDMYDIVVLLQPTSPLRNSADIDNAITLLFSKHARAIVSVCEAEHHPYWCNRVSKTGYMGSFIKKGFIGKRSQDLPVLYRINGAVYVAYRDYLERSRGFLGNRTYAYVMPRERSVDIDTDEDLRLAEAIMCMRDREEKPVNTPVCYPPRGELKHDRIKTGGDRK